MVFWIKSSLLKYVVQAQIATLPYSVVGLMKVLYANIQGTMYNQNLMKRFQIIARDHFINHSSPSQLYPFDGNAIHY